MQGENRLKLLK